MNNPRNPYRIKDYYAVDPEYGTDADLQAFVDAAHALEMKVLLDMVYLHCGPGAVFIEKRPHFVKRGASGEIVNEAWSFPGLNFESGELREYLWTNMAYWVCRFGVDGYRLDVGDGIPLDFWVEARRRLDAILGLCSFRKASAPKTSSTRWTSISGSRSTARSDPS